MPREIVRFGEFVADLHFRQLLKRGRWINIQEKPFQILELLLENVGETVSRDALRGRLWPEIRHGDLDNRLEVCVARLRHILSDPANRPRFIKTVSKHGYCFVGHVKKAQRVPRRQQRSRIRLAVLPFETPDTEYSYLSDGLAGEIINRLGHLWPHRLGVIAKSSVLKYKGSAKNLAQIGRELKSDYILEGNLLVSQEKKHITVQLIKVTDQTCIWADSYDYAIAEPLMIHDNIAERIAQSIGLTLTPEEAVACPTKDSTQSSEAHIAYLKGSHYQSKATEEDLTQSIVYFERAVQFDPDYALAYCGLAYSYSLLGRLEFSGSPRECFRLAADAAQKAYKINDRLANSHVVLAIVKYPYEWKKAESERLLRRALELNPSSALAHRLLSYLLSSELKHQEAIVEAKKACELDPLSLYSHNCLGVGYYLARRYDEAITTFQDILKIEPHFGLALLWLGATYSVKSMHVDAISILEQAKRHYRLNPKPLGWLGAAYGRAAMKAQAEELLDQLKELSAKRYVSAYDYALVYASLAQTDLCFEYLRKAFEDRDSNFEAFLQADPRFDILRSDPRYHELANSILVLPFETVDRSAAPRLLSNLSRESEQVSVK